MQVASVYTRTSSGTWQKSGSGTFKRENLGAVQLLTSCLRAFPQLIALDTKSFDLVGVVFRSTFSLDDELARVARATLLVLVAERPNQRVLLVKHFAIFVSNTITNSASPEFQDALRTLHGMMHKWMQLVKLASTDEAADTVPPVGTPSTGGSTPVKNDLAGGSPSFMRKSEGADASPRSQRRSTKGSRGSPKSETARAPSRRELRRMKDIVNLADADRHALEMPTVASVLHVVEGVLLSALVDQNVATRKLCLGVLRQARDLRVALGIVDRHVYVVHTSPLSHSLLPLFACVTHKFMSHPPVHRKCGPQSHQKLGTVWFCVSRYDVVREALPDLSGERAATSAPESATSPESFRAVASLSDQDLFGTTFPPGSMVANVSASLVSVRDAKFASAWSFASLKLLDLVHDAAAYICVAINMQMLEMPDTVWCKCIADAVATHLLLQCKEAVQ